MYTLPFAIVFRRSLSPLITCKWIQNRSRGIGVFFISRKKVGPSQVFGASFFLQNSFSSFQFKNFPQNSHKATEKNKQTQRNTTMKRMNKFVCALNNIFDLSCVFFCFTAKNVGVCFHLFFLQAVRIFAPRSNQHQQAHCFCYLPFRSTPSILFCLLLLLYILSIGALA